MAIVVKDRILNSVGLSWLIMYRESRPLQLLSIGDFDRIVVFTPSKSSVTIQSAMPTFHTMLCLHRVSDVNFKMF